MHSMWVSRMDCSHSLADIFLHEIDLPKILNNQCFFNCERERERERDRDRDGETERQRQMERQRQRGTLHELEWKNAN